MSTITATVVGNTYPHRSFLKSEGFVWDGDEWTMECEEHEDGRLDGSSFIKSNRKFFADRVSAHTKRQCSIEWS